MTARSDRVFRLDDWLVEPDLNRLSRPGESKQLEPKTMAVLVYLCRHADEVVSADQIIDAVWEGRPMGDNPVYKSVAKLRRALGDDSAKPRYIATVAKKGYRLLADVGAPANDVAAPVNARSRRRDGRRYLPLAIGMLAGVAIATIAFWRPQPELLTFRSVSGFSGSHSQPSFAPDGTSLAFVQETNKDSHIWVLDLDDTAPRQLTSGPSRDSRPRWAPNGQSILFMRQGGLWSVPHLGGEPVQLIHDAYNPNWSRDGSKIVFERRYEVWTASADGGSQVRVTGVPRKDLPLAPRWPAFSPDGGDIVYLDANLTPFADLWRVPAVGGAAIRLTFAAAFASAPVWSPDGAYIIYSSQRGGSRTLWRVDLENGESKPLLSGSGDDDFPDISADGRQLVYSNRRERFALILSDPDTGEHRLIHESRQLLLAPELSPDHGTIVYFSVARDGGVQIFTIPLVGGAPAQISSDPLATHAIPRWSADGKSLYFYHTRDAASFSRIGMSGGDAETIVHDWDWTVANGASVSPDETQVVYSRLTGQVPVQTLIRHLSTGKDEAFYATLEYPRWSQDGSSIIGALHVDQRFPGDIAKCPVTGPACRIIANDSRIPMFSSDESRIYYVRGFGLSQDLYVASMVGDGDERKLMTMAPLFPLGPFYDITEDDKIVWVRHEQDPSELWLTKLSE